MSGTLAVRFWRRVERSDGCWLWQGAKQRFGYGIMKGPTRKRSMLTHRVSWELHNGPVPDGLCVLHRCDVPACVRPDHLFLGTRPDNIRDMQAKGRDRQFRTKEMCSRGHPLSGDNLYVAPRGLPRFCRICKAMNTKASRVRRRLTLTALPETGM